MEAYIGLGSNLMDPIGQLEQAKTELARLPSTVVLACSSFYCSPPLGPRNQPDFVNAVVRLRTALAELALLDQLQRIERKHRRLKVQRWGRRTLDLDILLYGSRQFSHPRLTIPHPHLDRRAFVLLPLYELNQDLSIPGRGKLSRLARGLSGPKKEQCRRWRPTSGCG